MGLGQMQWGCPYISQSLNIGKGGAAEQSAAGAFSGAGIHCPARLPPSVNSCRSSGWLRLQEKPLTHSFQVGLPWVGQSTRCFWIRESGGQGGGRSSGSPTLPALGGWVREQEDGKHVQQLSSCEGQSGQGDSALPSRPAGGAASRFQNESPFPASRIRFVSPSPMAVLLHSQ